MGTCSCLQGPQTSSHEAEMLLIEHLSSAATLIAARYAIKFAAELQ
jgi:hypothetical protein